jgi:hypothetical protein
MIYPQGCDLEEDDMEGDLTFEPKLPIRPIPTLTVPLHSNHRMLNMKFPSKKGPGGV